MKLRVDFSLSKSFGVVERTIFRLVLNGYVDVREIGDALTLFSGPVIANGIRHLVNRQILVVDMDTGRLRLAEPLAALVSVCFESDVEIDVPDDLVAPIMDGGILIDSGTNEESRQFKTVLRKLKAALLEHLLPDVNLGLYIDVLDFTLTENERDE